MVINMDKSRLRTIEQIEQFLSAGALFAFSRLCDEIDLYEHITCVLNCFDYPQRNKRERGVLCCNPCGTPAATTARKSPGWLSNGPGTARQQCPCPSATVSQHAICPQVHAR